METWVVRQLFSGKFGIDILARFSEVFEEWDASGDLFAGEDELRLAGCSSQGRLHALQVFSSSTSGFGLRIFS